MNYKTWKELQDAATGTPAFAVAYAKEVAAATFLFMKDGPEKEAAEKILPLVGTWKPKTDPAADALLDAALRLYQSHLVDESECARPPKCGWTNFHCLSMIGDCATAPWKATEEQELRALDKVQCEVWNRLKPEWKGRLIPIPKPSVPIPAPGHCGGHAPITPERWIVIVTERDAGLAVLSKTARKRAEVRSKPARRLTMILDKLLEGSGILTREEWIRSQLKKIEAIAGPAPEGTVKFLDDLWLDSEWFQLDEAGKFDAFEKALEKTSRKK